MAPTTRRSAKKGRNGHTEPPPTADGERPPPPSLSSTPSRTPKHLSTRSNGTTTTKSSYDPSPRTTSYEFLGPPGALLVSTLVPLITLLTAFQCSSPEGCPVVYPFSAAPNFGEWVKQAAVLGDIKWWKDLWDAQAFAWYGAWYLFTVVCWAVLPGKWVEGVERRDGGKLWYKLNAFATFIATALACVAAYILYGDSPFLFIVDHFNGLVAAAWAMSLAQAFYCYAVSFGGGKMLALGGNSGNFLYDWFIGRELDPRIGIFDIKSFNELRPGLILWMLLDVAYCFRQYATSGTLTASLLLVTLFQSFYVIDALYFERAILTTMDITSDGFGHMLAIGDLLWVPFVYSLQARYLALVNPVQLGVAGTVGVLALQIGGYWLFRTANGDKDRFRNGKNPKNLQSMPTKRGTRLITSGLWGMSRHPNYLGDWIMALAWCLPTGFNTPMTYIYFGYFVVLLVHRQLRDDEACHKKYGADWEKYCSIVKWRIIPYVY